MARTTSDIVEEIAEFQGSISVGQCIYCLKKCTGEKKVKSYDIHTKCYDNHVNLSDDELKPGTLGELIRELDRF